jgi:predicted acylesterase/phospholipase RssA
MEQALATEHGREPNPVDRNGLCLLSLDGGGVRGLSTLYILKGIMARLNYERQATNLPRVKPCEVFDLIGGTSTGGYVASSVSARLTDTSRLIAIMLGRLEMDVEECISTYSKLMETVFGERSSWLPVGWAGRTKAQFDSKRLKNAIEEVISRQGASRTDLFNDGNPRGCRV